MPIDIQINKFKSYSSHTLLGGLTMHRDIKKVTASDTGSVNIHVHIAVAKRHLLGQEQMWQTITTILID